MAKTTKKTASKASANAMSITEWLHTKARARGIDKNYLTDLRTKTKKTASAKSVIAALETSENGKTLIARYNAFAKKAA